MKKIIEYSKKKMLDTLAYLEEIFSHINAGKANIHMLDNIKVEYYGNSVLLTSLANISILDAKTIIISVWEKSMIKTIEKALFDANIGITPETNGVIIRLNIPPLTEERRKQLIKQSRSETEKAKVSIRNIRREANDIIKKSIKDGIPKDEGKEIEIAIQKLHDKYLKKIDETFNFKEKTLITI